MNYFIKNIHVNKLFHLENIDIPISDESSPHLIITGKNGSGKTVLLNAIANHLNLIKDDDLRFLIDQDQLDFWIKRKESSDATLRDKIKAEERIKYHTNRLQKISGIITASMINVKSVVDDYRKGNYIFAFYPADRRVKMIQPGSPTKPKINNKKKEDVKETATAQFLNFLADLKIQEALARNENQIQEADEINLWFVDFERLLQRIFQDDNLRLEFNYKDYSFRICTKTNKFRFTEMSDGFAAILVIVADLILKMQDKNSLTRSYQKRGIVLIDEIETHLHLALQKIIMPFLTKVFPNIQFIVTTHSPFVLSSMPNAVAYDLEHREILDDLTEYSYESLAEGYFGVRTQSSYAEMQLETLRKLLEKETWTDADKVEIRQLKSDFEKIPETVSPLVVGGFRQMMIQYADKLKSL